MKLIWKSWSWFLLHILILKSYFALYFLLFCWDFLGFFLIGFKSVCYLLECFYNSYFKVLDNSSIYITLRFGVCWLTFSMWVEISWFFVCWIILGYFMDILNIFETLILLKSYQECWYFLFYREINQVRLRLQVPPFVDCS